MKAIHALEDCTPDPQNPNEGTLRGAQLLDRSLEKFGAARSILVDRNGVVVAGNKTLEAGVDRGLGAVVVESDGQTLVVVQRLDLDLSEPAARELAYMDNRVSDVGVKWTPEQMEADLARGIELGGMFNDDEREAILKMLDQAEVTTTLRFDDVVQYEQFMGLVSHIERTFPGPSTFGAKLTQWVLQQLAALDPTFSAT